MKGKLFLTFCIIPIFCAIAHADITDVSGKDKIKYIGDLVIEAGEVVDGDVVVMEGDLRIKGVVNGNAVVSYGDAFIDSGGVVNGDVVALRGKITVHKDATVTGEIVEQRLYDISLDDPNFRKGETDRKLYDEKDESSTEDDDAEFDAKLGYNKVDGFFLGIEMPKIVKSSLTELTQMTLHGFLGYGFSNKRWQTYIEMDKWFFENNRLEFGLEGHDLTDTEDDWIIGNEENSLAAFFLHEDFRDYFYREGFGAHIAQYIGDKINFKVKYLADEYKIAENETDWALFGGNKKFKPNFWFLGEGMNIIPGMMRSLKVSGEMKMLYGDLLLNGSFEYAGGDELGGDFEFTRYIFETRGYFDLDDHQGIDYRLKLGSSEKNLPPQKYFTLGGISTLRGFSYKEFHGKQMALLNLEYRLFSRSRPSKMWFVKLFQFALFCDIGSTSKKIFEDLDADLYHSDVGFSLMNIDGDFRVDFARRTDTGKKPWVITLRIKHAF